MMTGWPRVRDFRVRFRRLPSRFYTFEATDEYKASCGLSATPQLLGDFGFTYQKEPISRKNMNKI